MACLSPERQLGAADFLAYLAEGDSNEARRELFKIPSFFEAFNKAKKDVEAKKVNVVEQLKRK